jgi:hypothetical protein
MIVPPLKIGKIPSPSISFDYDHVLTLLSTPISLLVQTLLVKLGKMLTVDNLVKELTQAISGEDTLEEPQTHMKEEMTLIS